MKAVAVLLGVFFTAACVLQLGERIREAERVWQGPDAPRLRARRA